MRVNEIEEIGCDVDLYVKEYGLDNTIDTINSRIVYYNDLTKSFNNTITTTEIKNRWLDNLERLKKELNREKLLIDLGIK